MDLEAPPKIPNFFLNDPEGIPRAAEYLRRSFALFPQIQDLQAEYRPWRKVRRIATQRGIDPTDTWLALKLQRMGAELPLKQASGTPFRWCAGNHLNEPLHRIDLTCGGGGPASLSEHGVLGDEAHRTRLRIRTLMDEAAESSLIEGAATTRKVAVEMLRSRRDPRTKGERMVLNNYLAMQQIKEWLGQPLSTDMILDLQGILTEGTLADPRESKRWRTTGENVRVEDDRTQEVIYVPPSATGLEARIQNVCDFANAKHEGAEFIHPIIKACIIHFMVGYEHPFVDGNGRTARALFYWFALRSGYSIFEYLPISERIRAGFARYPQAYLDSELDDGDLTHFVLYKLDIIEQSLDAFARRIRHEEEKFDRSKQLIRVAKDLNLRQRLLLEHALRHPETLYTRFSHATSNGITLNTAAADLEGLARKRLLVRSKAGKEIVYHAAPGLAARVAKAQG